MRTDAAGAGPIERIHQGLDRGPAAGGCGHEGEGDGVTWDQIDQIEHLRRLGDLSWLRGRRTFDEFSTLLGLVDLFPVEPIRESAREYRR